MAEPRSRLDHGARSPRRRLLRTGNFSTNGLSLDGNTSYTDTGDINDARTHNTANEITQWRPDGSTNLTPVYDAAGDMTDDGRDYEFKYDALGRLVSVTQTGGTKKLVTAYRYNGLGYRIGWHYDVDADGTLESTSDDPWVYQTYDERWRVVATYIAGQSTPKEQFYHHAAGLDGLGGSSYIDSVILRDRDMTDASGPVAFTKPGDGTLEERVYYCQNWRADVSALVDYTSGQCLQLEHAKYLSYGTPWGLPAGDLDSDGDYDATDESNVSSLVSTSGYDVRADADLDGAVTNSDKSALSGSKFTLGRGFMSRDTTFNRRGYAGYENDGILGDGAVAKSNTRFWHVRHRVLDSTLGRWTTRDPLGYVDGRNLYIFMRAPVDMFPVDPGDQIEPWDCAATSASNAQCYQCCNSSVSGGRSRFLCYRYCNRRFIPPTGVLPFLPAPGTGGPCFRESSGHPACKRACVNTTRDTTDGIITHVPTSDGPGVLICCICDVTDKSVGECDDLADCITDRFRCFAFQNPFSASLECRSIECIRNQLACLRNKLNTTSEACRPKVRSAIQYWEAQLAAMQETCNRQGRTNN